MHSKYSIPALLCILPIVIFYWVVGTMAVNVPFQDDFDGLLEPVLHLHRYKTTLSEWWQVLVTQDDERRIIVDRLAAYLTYLISGEINLKTIILTGAINVLVLIWVVFQWFRATRSSWLLFAAVPWLLFNIQYYQSILWAMIPLQHLAVFVWALLTMWLLSQNTPKSFLGGLFTAALTIGADVSGNMIIGAGIVVLAAQFRWKELAIWTVFVGILVACYLSGLVIPEYRPKFSDNFANPLQLLSILTALYGLWLDPGPGFPFSLREAVAIITGIGTLGYLIFLLYKAVNKMAADRLPMEREDAFLWGSLAFVGVVLVVLATGRAAVGIEAVFTSRYRHMYIILLLLLYMLSIRNYPNWFVSRKVQAAVVGLSVLFGLNATYGYWGEMDRFRKTLLADGYQWYHNRSLPSSPIYLSLRERVDEIYEGVYEEGIYTPADYPFSRLPEAPVEGNAEINLVSYEGNVDVEVPDFVRKGGKDDGAYVIFRSPEGETHILPAYHSVRPVYRWLQQGAYYYPGARIDRYGTAYFRSSLYDVEIGVIEGDRQYRLITGKQLRL